MKLFEDWRVACRTDQVSARAAGVVSPGGIIRTLVCASSRQPSRHRITAALLADFRSGGDASQGYFLSSVSSARVFDETGFEMWLRPLLLLLLSIAMLPAAHAFERPFPAQAKRGKMTPASFPDIVIEGRLRQLAPGARIWNEDNLLQMPASLRGSGLAVNYTEDVNGHIDRVWILTANEASEPITKQTQTPTNSKAP